MNYKLSTAVSLILLCAAACGAATHLDIAVPDRMDTDLTGPVRSIDMKTSVNVSGQFERTYREYDETGNLIIETEWDADGACLNTLTNFYNEVSGCFERQLYISLKDKFTNDWEVILSPDTRQIALKKQDGETVVYTYSPERYLTAFRFVDADRKLVKASATRRDEENRRIEYTLMDEDKDPLYTYWFKWKSDGRIDRERQRYRKEEGERLHEYTYIEHDPHGNWTQRLMVRYDIGGREKRKVFERVVTRTITYFGESDTTGAAADDATAGVTDSGVVDTNRTDVATGTDSLPDTASTPEDPEAFDYTFDDLSDKLVIINCKGPAGSSAGSGFIARMDGKTYLFTNQHVIMGSETMQFRTADGETLTPRSVELSMTRDIARLLIDDREALDISSQIALGSRVGVFGNSEGAGVATELFGTVKDLGIDVVEVSAEFVSGNSGSPVLDRNRQVIGIATFVRVIYEPKEKIKADAKEESKDDEENYETKTRRFCYRLTDLEWKPVNWKSYNGKYGDLYLSSERIAANVFALLNIWSSAPTKKIALDDDMPSDLANWVKRHNGILSLRGGGFYSAYANSMDQLAETCKTRARRIRMFSTQRELTEFLRVELENNARALEYAHHRLLELAENIRH